jgi:hypothetical protein
VEHMAELHSNSRLLASSANIRREKSMAVENTLAYYVTATITAIKVLKYRPGVVY